MANVNEHVHISPKECRSTYYSLDEFADAALRNGPKRPSQWENVTGSGRTKWRGGTLDETMQAARNGWEEHLTETLAVAESAVEMCEKMHEIEAFVPEYSVAGADVDVAAYLSGEPECMISYPLTTISKVGRVVTLCANICVSSAINAGTLIRRGQVLTALALALSRLGHSTELWADFSCKHYDGKTGCVRVLVKGANDVLDPAKILFAYAHPGALRCLAFGTWHGFPKGYTDAAGYGSPSHGAHDLPEGTIYLPEITSNRDIPDAHEELKRMLGELGLLAE